MRKIELFTTDGVKVGEFTSMNAIAEIADALPENLDVSPMRSHKKQELSDVTDLYFYSQAKARGGYLNMGEITYDASQGDPDATFLKQLYDAIWAKEEELEAQLEQMSLEQLFELDLETWAKEAYDQVKAELEKQQTEQTTEQ